jgi:two-component system cell cycle response regulator
MVYDFSASRKAGRPLQNGARRPAASRSRAAHGDGEDDRSHTLVPSSAPEPGQNPHIAPPPDSQRHAGPELAGRVVPSDRRLLIVEDSPTMRKVMRRFLDSTGYTIFEAGDGEEALRIAARERPDVILLDRQIPLLDGYGVLASLQTDPELGEVPVVLVTSHSEPEDVADGLRRGAHDYLRKPFEQPELVARVHAAMRTKALRDELRARNAQLERLVSTDLLTGLLNRGATADHLRALVSRSQRHGLPLSVVLLDVDGIGDVNAALGHSAGDRVLEEVAARVRDELREEDAAGRWSGDELLVVAPDTSATGVAPLVGRLCGSVDAAPLPLDGGTLAISVSAGWATWAEGDDAEALVRRAERELAAGRAERRGPAAADA